MASTPSNVEQLFADMGVEAMHLKGARLSASSVVVVASSIWFFCLFYCVELTPNAFVFGDEAGYFLPLIFGASATNYQRWGSSIAEYPSYLYFWLYSFLRGNDLHFAVKALNAGFIASTAIPAFIVARRYLPQIPAAAFACFVMLTPISSFARYVMPESMYLFGFWCSLALVFLTIDRSQFLAAILAGFALGLLSLIKPHAIAIALATSCFFILRSLSWRGVLASVVAFFAFYATHAGVGFLLTGTPLWSVSGGSYGGILTSRIDWSAAAYNAFGHSLALVAMFGPLLLLPINVWWREQKGDRNVELGILVICLVAMMVAMTVYFSQSRLHGRYYLYCLPLFILFGAAVLNEMPVKLPPKFSVAMLMLASPACALLIYMFYEVSPFDYPDVTLLGGRSLKFVSIGLILFQLCVATACLFKASSRQMIGLSLSLFVTVEMTTTFGLVAIAPFGPMKPKPVDAAFLGTADEQINKLIGRSDGVVIGGTSTGGDLPRAMFYLRSLSRGQFAPAGDQVVDAQLPSDINWAILLPGIRYLGNQPTFGDRGLTIILRGNLR